MLDTILPEFQQFLIDKDFASQKHAPFYARWVSKFISFSNTANELDPEKRIEIFITHLLKNFNTPDWQIDQARNALKLYLYHFNGNDLSKVSADKKEFNPVQDYPEIERSLRSSMRLKHYSY